MGKLMTLRSGVQFALAWEVRAMKDHKLVFIVTTRNLATFSCIGVPDNNLKCYCMTWEDVANTTVV